MAGAHGEFLAGGGVEDPRGPIVTGGGDPGAVGAVGHPAHRAVVAARQEPGERIDALGLGPVGGGGAGGTNVVGAQNVAGGLAGAVGPDASGDSTPNHLASGRGGRGEVHVVQPALTHERCRERGVLQVDRAQRATKELGPVQSGGAHRDPVHPHPGEHRVTQIRLVERAAREVQHCSGGGARDV